MLTAKHRTTVQLALIAWKVRCKTEAEQMESWANNEYKGTELEAKCRANAKASRQFILDAEEALRELK